MRLTASAHAATWAVAAGAALSACGGTDPGVGAEPTVSTPTDVEALSLPQTRFAAALGDRFAVAADPVLGPLAGNENGLFSVGADGLGAIDDSPVAGLVMYAPQQAVVGAASGVAVYGGDLQPSPLADALTGMVVQALAVSDHGLWLGTDQALHLWRDGELQRFDATGPVRAVRAARGVSRVVVAGLSTHWLLEEIDGAWSLLDLGAERPLDDAFALADGSVLGLDSGALWRRIALGEGQIVWRPQALAPDGEAPAIVEAAAQDPARGAVWLLDGQSILRLDGPQVARQDRPSDDLGALAVDELGAVWLSGADELVRVGIEGTPITYRETISAFSEANCERCHAPLGTARPLDDFEAWKADVDNIISALDEGRMPLDGQPLVGGSADTVRRWKEGGLLY